MEVLLYTILTLCALGVFSAVILYFVARKFRIDEVEKMLPGANCGGCGFAGCRGMADALVKRDDISALFCPVGGGDCMKAVAAYLGKAAAEKFFRNADAVSLQGCGSAACGVIGHSLRRAGGIPVIVTRNDGKDAGAVLGGSGQGAYLIEG